MNTFSIGEAVKKGWELTKNNFGLWVGIMLTFAAVNIIFDAITPDNEGSILTFAVSIVSYVVQLILDLGAIAIVLKLLNGQPAKYTDLFSMYPYTLHVLVASIVMIVGVVLGLIVLIIPGIYIALRLCMAVYLVADEKLPGIEALKRSWQLTRGYALQLLFLSITLVVLNIIGALLLLIGLLVTAPIAMIAMGFAYQKIKAASAIMPVPAPTPTPIPAGR